MWVEGAGAGCPARSGRSRRSFRFPLVFKELHGAGEFQAGPYVVDAFRVNHRVTCYGYRITIEDGRF